MRRFAIILFIVAAFWPLGAAGETASFAQAGNAAAATLTRGLYAGGAWRECDAAGCPAGTSDWGADADTYALYLRWATTHDPSIPALLRALAVNAPRYGAPCDDPAHCPAWSDTPSWDAVALVREYQATGDAEALRDARDAIRYVADSAAFAGGACPSIVYQRPHDGTSTVKSLETESNLIKAELLADAASGDPRYRADAVRRYVAARASYYDRAAGLYTVHVADDGTTCIPVAGRYFASVNGEMIWDGLALAAATGEQRYAGQAIATAHAVASELDDDRGVFLDAGGENDVEEPLVEAMLAVARRADGDFARTWIVTNAAAALSARGADGTFARFFDGPPQSETSAWESNGGIALEIAAAAIAPKARTGEAGAWTGATAVGAPLTTVPATIRFTGSGIALFGTLGPGCEYAHVEVVIDGRPTADRTGMWKNAGLPGGSAPAVMFAWRWAAPGTHTVQLVARDDAAASVDLQAYALP